MASRSRPGQPAVGREALGQNQQVLLLLRQRGRRWCTGTRRCWRRRPSWPRTCSRRPARTSSARSVSGVQLGVAGLALPDEPGVFGEAAGVQIERNAVTARSAALHRLDVRQRDRLAAAGIVGDGQHAPAECARGPRFRSARSSAATSMLPLNGRLRLRVGGFGEGRSTARAPGEFDVGARGVEMRVVGDHVARLAHAP